MSGLDDLRRKPGVQHGDYYDALDDVREALLTELDRLRDAQELPSVRIGWNGALDAVRNWAGDDQRASTRTRRVHAAERCSSRTVALEREQQ